MTSQVQPRPTHSLVAGAIALAALLLCAYAQWADRESLVRVGDEWLRDRFIALAARTVPDDRILVVDIDEQSIAQLPWPWPRGHLAELVERLFEHGARGVAFDILLEKPGDPAGDSRLAALAANGPFVLAQMFDYVERDQPLASGTLGGGIPAPRAPGMLPATGYLGAHAGLSHARHFGNIGVLLDPDGVLRRVPMQTWFRGRVYPTLSRELIACCAGGTRPPAVTGQVRVPYRRSLESFTVVAAADVLLGRLPPGLAAGRLVLVGSSSLSIGDRVATPLGAATAGLLVHAEMLSAQLDELAGTAPRPWPGTWLAVLFTAATVAAFTVTASRLSGTQNAALLLGGMLLWLVAAAAIAPHDANFSPAAPLYASLFLLLVAVPFHWQQSQQRSRQLLGTLRQYVASDVVDELLRKGLKNPLQPRLLHVTTLIADMQDYTRQVEQLSLDEASALTQKFLDCLTGPVLQNRGTLDKYTGDGLVAFWGAPLANDEHADLALDAARGILHEVARLSREREAGGLPPLRVRIGIESGPAMAGDFGTRFRSIYTAVGDSVNTASRLEQAARDYPHDVIVGPGTVALARRHRFIALGERQFRGKEKRLQIYTLEAA